MSVFTKAAGSYDDWYKTDMGAFIDEVETRQAFVMIKIEKGMEILDIGCGTGNFSIKLADKGCSVTGIDISQEMLNKARAKTSNLADLDIEYQLMDVYKLKFADETFDAVFSMAAFEFIKEPQAAYEEMYRVLKPGGQMLIGTINRDSPWGKSYINHAWQNENSVFRFAEFKTLSDLLNLDRDHVVKQGECLFIPPDYKPSSYNFEEENRLSSIERGGYICVLYRKPI